MNNKTKHYHVISFAPATQISMHVELATSKTKLFIEQNKHVWISGLRCQSDWNQ